jgi:molybdopterin converting factor subunit 1
MPEGTAPVGQVRVRALFFALYRDLIGTDTLEVEMPRGSAVRDLVETIRRDGPAKALPDSPVVAVNEEYSALDRLLNDGDEVAFIPPVAGG